MKGHIDTPALTSSLGAMNSSVSFPQSSFHNMKISHRGLRPSVHSGGSGASAAPPCADARIVCLMVKENGQVV